MDVILPRERPEMTRFTGDAAPLVGTYSGPARGRELSLTVTLSGAGIAVAADGGQPTPLSWVEGWTFQGGPTRIVTFERQGADGPATVLRLDGGSSHYVLRRRPD